MAVPGGGGSASPAALLHHLSSPSLFPLNFTLNLVFPYARLVCFRVAATLHIAQFAPSMEGDIACLASMAALMRLSTAFQAPVAERASKAAPGLSAAVILAAEFQAIHGEVQKLSIIKT